MALIMRLGFRKPRRSSQRPENANRECVRQEVFFAGAL